MKIDQWTNEIESLLQNELLNFAGQDEYREFRIETGNGIYDVIQIRTINDDTLAIAKSELDELINSLRENDADVIGVCVVHTDQEYYEDMING